LGLFYLLKNSPRLAATAVWISSGLLERYLSAPYSLHLRRNSSEMLNNVSAAAHQVSWVVLGSVAALVSEALGILAVLVAQLPSLARGAAAVTAGTTIKPGGREGGEDSGAVARDWLELAPYVAVNHAAQAAMTLTESVVFDEVSFSYEEFTRGPGRTCVESRLPGHSPGGVHRHRGPHRSRQNKSTMNNEPPRPRRYPSDQQGGNGGRILHQHGIGPWRSHQQQPERLEGQAD
jgi:hypothetical protein